MELSLSFQRLVSFLGIAFLVLIIPVYGQINTPCTASMISSVSPCMNFLTNSTSNGTSPTTDCCNALKSLTSTSRDCACLVVTGSVPFQIPINRTLAISLPRACNMPGVPLQCKASGSPLPAPGPASLSPEGSPVASPTATIVPEPTPSPESDTTPLLTPPSPSVDAATPTETTGSRVTPSSAAVPSYKLSPSLLLFALGFLALKYC